MGFIARTVPQMNILSFGFSLRILFGLLVLIAGAAALATVYQDATATGAADGWRCTFGI